MSPPRAHRSDRSPTRAIDVLRAAGVEFTVHEYEHSSSARSFGLEAAEQVGADPARMFKTLLVKTDSDDYVVAIVPVDSHLSMKAIARTGGHKSAQMADPAVAQRRTGYVVGGISPLGQTTPHRTFIDETVLDFDTVFVSGGQRGLSVELSGVDLAMLLDAELAELHAER